MKVGIAHQSRNVIQFFLSILAVRKNFAVRPSFKPCQTLYLMNNLL